MYQVPEFSNARDYENGFFLTCDLPPISKFLAHYELFKQTRDIPGAFVECGVFKGVSLSQFAMLRDLLGPSCARPIIAFDTFAKFPTTEYGPDHAYRQAFVDAAGSDSISAPEMQRVLAHKQCGHAVELVPGDICDTVPRFVEQYPHLKISLLNLDTDVYEPAVVVLKYLYPRISRGGILMIDNYGVFPGETDAVDEYFRGDQSLELKRLPLTKAPTYIVKP